MTRVLIAGGGGFIGGHLTRRLRDDGCSVRCVDIKPLHQWQQRHDDVENLVLDLSEKGACVEAMGGMHQVYDLAADMGGMGFIENNKAACMLSVLTGTHLLLAARDQAVDRFFFASSACVYAADRQTDPNVIALREDDVYPAMPEDGYGWEKLFFERMCRHFSEDFGLETRVARFHNVFGPYGTWDGGREKAPAALCRKIAQAKQAGVHEIDVWGDGEQTRSFMYIDDCIEGTVRLMASGVAEPLNVGSSELVSINQMIDTIGSIAGISVTRRHDLSAPQGVRGRNSDNTRVRELLGWEPSTRLADGLRQTYDWIAAEVAAQQA